jgi:hypothetical protein
MAISIGFVVVMFARWEAFIARGRQMLWWGLLATFLLLDFLFILVPIREGQALRRLSAAGRGWAAAAWLLVILFLWVVVPTNAIALRRQHPILVTSAGLLLLAALVVAIWRVSNSWVRESLRSIVARPGGGFLVEFAQADDSEISAALAAIPGAARTSDADSWNVPADAAAAAALLHLAKKFDFEFVPEKKLADLEDLGKFSG